MEEAGRCFGFTSLGCDSSPSDISRGTGVGKKAAAECARADVSGTELRGRFSTQSLAGSVDNSVGKDLERSSSAPPPSNFTGWTPQLSFRPVSCLTKLFRKPLFSLARLIEKGYL